ncbi:aryl-sulfate sulfotransferase [Psychroflexus planctonicus]|uniref:Secretion system C-terminal sorting domain-containing protein n=1 Tax=Psychroflexus planctonicus TaxID=1526575 RepID=A0ABQ1SBN4_9FLAO|nr:aryl-sulfate sulfotransferase [Psychroflexus planctonicus]GGE24013.1 hypothetical protein GCM10010832_00870 [Psychroflexus planctonicus]
MIHKLKKYILSTLVILICQFANAQNTVGTTFVTSDVYDGFTLLNIGTNSYLINNCGEVMNEWNSVYPPGNAVYLLPNGNLLRAGRVESGSSISMGGAGGIIELFDWNGNLIWSYLYNDENNRQHHDVYPMPNGNVLILAATIMTEEEAIDAGRDPNLLPDNRLYNEQIIEVEPIGAAQANIVWEWNIKDHLIQDFDNSKLNFGNVANSPEKLDINFLNGASGSENWLHFNSIQYDEELDQIVISCRNLSEIYIIDHSTTTQEAATSNGGTYGKGGDLLYRWGNPQAYQQGTAEDRTLFGQHTPYFIEPGLDDEGKIMLFNNGFQRTPEFSEVLILTPPTNTPGFYTIENESAYGPVSADYIYSDLSENPSPFYSHIVSSAQRLPNGNILICEGISGRIFEIDENENLVWEYQNPESNSNNTAVNQGEEAPGNNLLFRATKYASDYPAFTNHELTPGEPLEGNPDLTQCNNVLSQQDFEITDVNIYPNPTSGTLYIKTDFPIEELNVFDLNGKKMLKQKMTDQLDVSNLDSGIYFLVLKNGSNYITKKIVKR